MSDEGGWAEECDFTTSVKSHKRYTVNCILKYPPSERFHLHVFGRQLSVNRTRSIGAMQSCTVYLNLPRSINQSRPLHRPLVAQDVNRWTRDKANFILSSSVSDDLLETTSQSHVYAYVDKIPRRVTV
jgi:hypothetical protein